MPPGHPPPTQPPPKNKESISLKLEEYLLNKKVQLEQFIVDRGRLDEVFRKLTTKD